MRLRQRIVALPVSDLMSHYARRIRCERMTLLKNTIPKVRAFWLEALVRLDILGVDYERRNCCALTQDAGGPTVVQVARSRPASATLLKYAMERRRAHPALYFSNEG